MRLTPNFTLSEFLRSSTAERFPDIKREQQDPSPSVIENLTYLASTVLQPIRDDLEWPIRINSGYRCKSLNTKIGGSKSSQHMKGEAADLDILRAEDFLVSPRTAYFRAATRALYEHATGRDFPVEANANFYLFAYVALDLELYDVDQIIHEYGPPRLGEPAWVHIASSQRQDRRRISIVHGRSGGFKHSRSLRDLADGRWIT